MSDAGRPVKGGNSREKDIVFSIGFKLVTIITILLLVSLGAITVLVSYFVTTDVRRTAEENNFTINQRSEAEVELVLGMIRSNTLALLDTLDALEEAPEVQKAAETIFFEQNADVAYIHRTGTGGDLVNEAFFSESEADFSGAAGFIAGQEDTLERTRGGELVLLNASPSFGIPVLTMFSPRGGGKDPAVIFFSSDSLDEIFGTGTNSTFMVNDESDLLLHADAGLVKAGASMASDPFVKALWENSAKNRQSVYADLDGKSYFAAFRKLSIANAAVITRIETALVFEGVNTTTTRNLFLTGAVLCAAILCVWFFSKSMSGPLKKLAGAAIRIREGDFQIDLLSKSRDEIGLLTGSFNTMGKALEIFGHFTNREIAVRAMNGEIKPGGLPKHATVFFSDIRGFTEKSEAFTRAFGDEASNKIIHWLNQYFTSMVDCVEKTGGVVDKFIGDAVMAHWGTAYSAGSPEKDAFNCVKAALMMRNALVKMNTARRHDDPGDPPIRIGCGINTGIVTAGQLGSEQRMEYTVIGDPVNLASRTEALNKPLGTDILITEDTWNLLGKYLVTEEMPPVRVKGKEKPVRMFAVVNIKKLPGPQSLAEVRELLSIEPPDLTTVDTGAEEKKYKIGADQD